MMHRLRRQRDAELIGHAYSLLPPRLAHRLEHTHFLAGVDPNFIGLHHDKRTHHPTSRRQDERHA